MFNAYQHCRPIGVYQYSHLLLPPHGQDSHKKWHLFMRITMPVIYERRERSNDEEIHDLINLIKNIYNGNPPKYMIREGKSETDVKLVM